MLRTGTGARTGRVARCRLGEARTGPYPWASVTKLCTALAVLVAVEEGTRRPSRTRAGPPGVDGRPPPGPRLGPRASTGGAVLAAPGRRRIYSNAGYELLAAHLEARPASGSPTYLREAVLEPLAMAGSRLDAVARRPTALTGILAGPAVPGRPELMAPRLVAPATLDRATSVAFPGLDGVLPGFGRQRPCDWGLGFELRGRQAPHWTGVPNSPRTFGHFGRAGGLRVGRPGRRRGAAPCSPTPPSGRGRPPPGRPLAECRS